MPYHHGGLPPEFVPPPIVEPLDAERFVTLLYAFIRKQSPENARDLKIAVEELFRRLAT